MVYTIVGATRAFASGFGDSGKSGFALYDARLDIPLFTNVNISLGKQKEPISLSRMTMLLFLPMQERASGRATALPYLSADESNLVHLGVGLRYSGIKDEIIGKSKAEFYQAPLFVETGLFSAEASFTYNLELFWRKGPFLVGGEYTGANVSSSSYDDPRVHGFNIGASWIITGEMRSYRKKSGVFNPVPVSKPVNTAGWGSWELALRFSSLDLSSGKLEGGIMDSYSLGLNWWPTPRTQVSPNYRYIILDRFGEKGKSSGINLRLSFILD